jgi:hypothetical protein
MVDLSNWTKAHPSATSRVRDLPSGYRSDKSYTRAAWEQEHYFEDGSADSAGVHKVGSGVLPGRDDGLPNSTGTAAYEVSYAQDTGRLYASGSSLSHAQPLSAGTQFDIIVVGEQSLATGNVWVMSFKTADTGSYVTWSHLSFLDTPYVYYSPVVDRGSSGNTTHHATLQNLDASGGTFLGQHFWGGSTESFEAQPFLGSSVSTAFVTFLAVGQVERSRLS